MRWIGHLPDPDADEAELIGSIESIRPIEMADSRKVGWPRGVGHAAGDNACCGWLVSAGTGLASTGIDFAGVATEMGENDVPIVAGKGSDCMGSILNVYPWFAAKALLMGWAVQHAWARGAGTAACRHETHRRCAGSGVALTATPSFLVDP